MALLAWGASRCSICHELLIPGQLIMATTHFIADPADPLCRFSDTGMHAACFVRWEHRDEFAARYQAVMGRTLSGWVPAVPANPDAPPLPRFRLAVLSTPESRADYFAALLASVAPDAVPGGLDCES